MPGLSYHNKQLPVLEALQIGLYFFHKSASLHYANAGPIISDDLRRGSQGKGYYHAAAHQDDENNVDWRWNAR